MPQPVPKTRNYEPYTQNGTAVRSTEKEIERTLLAAAFEAIENGNLEDNALDTRVYKDESVTLVKLANEVIDRIDNSKSIAIVARQDFVSTVGQTIFTFPFDFFPGSKELLVFLDGALLRLGGIGVGNYTEISSNQIQMNVALAANQELTGLKIGLSGGTPKNRQDLTVAEGQTLINLPLIYQPGSDELLVFRNGAKAVVNIDFSETSATSITWLYPLAQGDRIELVIYEAPNSQADVVSRRIGTDAQRGVFENWLRQNVSYSFLFFELANDPAKQHASGTANYLASTQEISGDGNIYVAKANLSFTGTKAKIIYDSNGVGTLTFEVSTDDGFSLTAIANEDTEVILSGSTGTQFHVQITFAGGAVLRNFAVIIAP